MKNSFTVSGKVVKYPGAPWHFLSLSRKVSARIGKLHQRKGKWWYAPVYARIGQTTWKISLWPKREAGIYLLMVTAAVRKKENIFEDDNVRVIVTLT